LDGKDPGRIVVNRFRAYWSAIWKSLVIIMRPLVIFNQFYNYYKVKKDSEKQFLIKVNYFEVTHVMQQISESQKYHGAVNDFLIYFFILSRFYFLVIGLINYHYRTRV
jgi:predicted neutral ceramidase superfamily lipid hydrolase